MPWIKSCLCHQEKKKSPTISPPIHLLLKNEDSGTSSTSTQGPSHAFRCKTFKKPRPCHLCHQPILNQGSCCRVCKYVCHKVCESKEAVQRYTDTSWQIYHQNCKKCPSNNNNNKVITGTGNSITNNKDQITQTSGSDTDTLTDIPVKNSVKQNGNVNAIATSTDGSNNKNKDYEIIDSVEVTYEPINSKCANSKSNRKVEVILHTHDEPNKNNVEVNKMYQSSSYSNGFGSDALTTQPRGRSTSSATVMDLSYITERIIALWFPSSTTPHSYRQGQRQAAHMLKNKHGDNYMVFNLSEPKRALRSEHKHIKEMGWAPNLAPPLERICSVCKEIETWLSGDQHRIAVLHARGNKDQLGVIVSAYMHYSNICGTAEQALDRFSMRKFLEDNVGSLILPSNKRYVEYFAGLLSHNIKINIAPIYLTHVTVLGAPAFHQGGCKAFLKLYEGHNPVYTSGIYNITNSVSQFTVNVSGERRRGLQLRGDILIKCYHRNELGRETIFACQFHTCAVADQTLSFTKQELDVACNDCRFPMDGAVELHFSAGPEGRHFAPPAPTPAVPFTLATDDPVTRSDSPLQTEQLEEEDSDSDDVNHTFGPLDGSIYATIAKKPELSPGAVSSPLTVSMDSGISSAGHQQNANTTASTSPPPTAQPSPLSPEDQHRELDELLNDMMLNVQSIPDIKSHQDTNHHHQSSSGANFGNSFDLDNVRYIDQDEEQDKNIPYHARQDSRPFSYGINANMIGDSKGLSSPSLVRKASVNKSHGDTLNKVQTQVYPDYNAKPVPNFSAPQNYSSNSNYNTLSSKYSNYTPPSSQLSRNHDPIDDLFTESALNAQPLQPIKKEFREAYYKDERKRYNDPLKRSFTDGTLRRSPEKIEYRSPYSDSESLSPPGVKSPEFHENFNYNYNNNMTWLQKQQQKLRERREILLREERQPHESRLLSELKSVQSRHILRPSASHRVDGYTSDTTAFADDDEDFKIPLHISTMHGNNNSGNTSSTYSTLQSNYSSSRERPFVTVRRQHEKFNQNSDPAAVLAANPLGHVITSPRYGGDTVDSGLLSLVEQQQQQQQQLQQQQQHQHHQDINRYNQNQREETFNTYQWRSQSEMDSSPSHNSSPRPQTPAFPVHARTPYSTTPTVQFDLPSERLPPKSPTTQRRLSYPSSAYKNQKWSLSPDRKDRPTSPTELNGSEYYSQRSMSATGEYQHSPKSPSYNGSSSPTVYYGSRRSSITSSNEAPHEVAPANVKFVRDTSNFWYKPNITREEAISMLREQSPGTFIVRDSNSFPGAYGLALRVATVPSNVQTKSNSGDELIRHFLIEPTSKGVRLKGLANEPVFTSLSALVYQHSITQMALPCRLIVPQHDLHYSSGPKSAQQQLLTQGAACNVIYLYSMDTESLTGPQAIRRAVQNLLQKPAKVQSAVVHFKVNDQGITLTDNKRKLFFRKHYPILTVSHCGLDPDENKWVEHSEDVKVPKNANRIFGFVAKKSNATPDNQCHLFAEMEPEQPATAIVNFVNKVLSSSGIKPNIV